MPAPDTTIRRDPDHNLTGSVIIGSSLCAILGTDGGPYVRLLLIEDDRRLSHVLGLSLGDEGYAVDRAYDGVEGQELAEAEEYDAIILDVLLPRRDGLEVCRALRQRGIGAPILMLTARDAVADRVRGLDSGAD